MNIILLEMTVHTFNLSSGLEFGYTMHEELPQKPNKNLRMKYEFSPLLKKEEHNY